MSNVYWPLYEVFVRGKQGLSHRHVGSLHAADERMALENARDTYTRRSEGCSIWVVKASEIVASQPEERGEFFDPAESTLEDRISEEKAYGLFHSGAGAVSGAPAGGLDKAVAARAAEPLEDEGGVQGDRSE